MTMIKIRNTCTELYERVNGLLDYNPITGEFKWMVSKNGVRKGSVAGGLCKSNGYIYIRVDKKLYKAHKLAYLLTYGCLPENRLDHANRCKTDNRIENLKWATKSCNS